MADANGRRRSGRQLSDEATQGIRTTALRLASEIGPQNLTMEGIASSSGVAKTTIYRRWPNAAAVIMDAFLCDVDPIIRYRPQPQISETMIVALKDFVRSLTPERLALLRHLIGSAQADEELAKAFWANWISPRRQEGALCLGRRGLFQC
ncbi:TetR/AcrR family transcriptional regulator [Roseovarius sp. B08]|uniref:TetR/AcrR family transcriptional regulator n=1 Tax=Roseovarius sp. B08 TaxID=3449223 RepID=UPI003EDC3953